jgi:DNA-binding transcriptional LysR family regulator
MDNRKYEAFERVARNGSITKTAEEMGYTQSGVTQMLNSLEAELGLSLIMRTNKGASLTTSGRDLLPFIREEQIWEKRIREECGRMLGKETGSIEVGSLTSIASAIMPRALDLFRERHPGIRINLIELGTQPMTRMLADGRIDAAFMEIEGNEHFESKELFKDEIKAIVSFDHPLARRKKVTLEELNKYPFIAHTTSDSDQTNVDWAYYITGTKMDWDVKFSCDDDLMLLNMVAHDLGVSLAGSVMVSNYPGKVAEISLSPRRYRTLGVVVRSKKYVSPAARAYIDTVEEVVMQGVRERRL